MARGTVAGGRMASGVGYGSGRWIGGSSARALPAAMETVTTAKKRAAQECLTVTENGTSLTAASELPKSAQNPLAHNTMS